MGKGALWIIGSAAVVMGVWAYANIVIAVLTSRF